MGYFQQNYAISSATYYRKIVELNDLLNEFNLRIKRGKLVGEENKFAFSFLIFSGLSLKKNRFRKRTWPINT